MGAFLSTTVVYENCQPLTGWLVGHVTDSMTILSFFWCCYLLIYSFIFVCVCCCLEFHM